MPTILDEVKSNLIEMMNQVNEQTREYTMWYEENVVPNTPVNANANYDALLRINGMLLPKRIKARGMPELVLKLEDIFTMQGWSYIEHEIAATYDKEGVQGVIGALCGFLGDMEACATIKIITNGVEKEYSMRFGVDDE